MVHLLRLRVQDGVIEEMLKASVAGLPDYHLTNDDLIRTHIWAEMIHFPHTLHRQANGRFVAQISDDDLLCPQSFHG